MSENIEFNKQEILKSNEYKQLKHIGNLSGMTLVLRMFLVNTIFSILVFLIAPIIIFLFTLILPHEITIDIAQILEKPAIIYSINIITMMIANTLPFVLLLKSSKINIQALFNTSQISIKLIMAGAVVCLGLNFILSIGTNAFLILLEQLFQIQPHVPDFTPQTMGMIEFIPFFIFTCVVAPLTEEFIFRGALLAPLRKYGDLFAIVVTSILFSLVHGNLGQIPGALIIGLVLGFVTVKSGSIIPAIIIHFINNGFAVLQSYAIAFDTQNVLAALIGFIMIGLMIASILLLVSNWAYFKTIKAQVTYFKPKELYQGYFTSIGFLIFLGIMLFNIIITLF